MAEPTLTPSLPSTTDPSPYVPVSWMAVAAAVASGLFVVVLLALSASAFISKRPLIMPELMVFPVVGVVLSFAARRLIRNSEGTRTGEQLVNAAWWVSVVAGLGYAAYLFAIDLSIRRDAENEVQRWVGHIIKGDTENLDRAFLRTLEPGRRVNLRPGTPDIQAQFRDSYLAFSQCDLVQIARRNAGTSESRFTPGGLRDWSYRPGTIDCMITGVFKCPEGSFPVNIPLRGIEGTSSVEGGARQWQIVPVQNGYISRSTISLTPYGWLVANLHHSGGLFGKNFLEKLGSGTQMYPFVYHDMIGPPAKRPFWLAVGETAQGRVAISGAVGAFVPYYTDDYANYFRNQFFRLPGGTEPTNEQKLRFQYSWLNYGLVPSGTRLRNSPDTNDYTVISDKAVEVFVPCELPFPSAEGSSSAARCRIVVSCEDPALIEELKRLRAEANPDQGTQSPPDSFSTRNFPWRIVRLETDLNVVTLSGRAESVEAGR